MSLKQEPFPKIQIKLPSHPSIIYNNTYDGTTLNEKSLSIKSIWNKIKNFILPVKNAPIHHTHVLSSTLTRSHSSQGSLLQLTRYSTRESFQGYGNNHDEELSNNTREALMKINNLKLSDFEILKTLGIGSFGFVCLANLKHSDLSTNPVALKIIKKDSKKILIQLLSVRQEKEIFSKVNLPFIAPLYNFFEDKYHFVFVLKYINGGELFTRLRRLYSFEPSEAAFYAAEVILAIEYLHSMNIIYRDLKPENILFNHAGHIRLVDFGLAKQMTDDLTARSYTVCGTNEYMAPEMLLRKGYRYSIDWWAIGILLYEMLTGRAPFYDSSPYSLFCKILGQSPSIPNYLKTHSRSVLHHLLNKDPNKRLANETVGTRYLKNHKFFQNLNWMALAEEDLTPPYIPTIQNPHDTSHFADFPSFREYSPRNPWEAEINSFEEF